MMVTTDRLIPIDAFERCRQPRPPYGLVPDAGSGDAGGPDTVPTHVELCLDATQVSGMSLETGARYQARGAYRIVHDPHQLPDQLDLVGTFRTPGVYAR